MSASTLFSISLVQFICIIIRPYKCTVPCLADSSFLKYHVASNPCVIIVSCKMPGYRLLSRRALNVLYICGLILAQYCDMHWEQYFLQAEITLMFCGALSIVFSMEFDHAWRLYSVQKVCDCSLKDCIPCRSPSVLTGLQLEEQTWTVFRLNKQICSFSSYNKQGDKC